MRKRILYAVIALAAAFAPVGTAGAEEVPKHQTLFIGMECFNCMTPITWPYGCNCTINSPIIIT